MGNLSDYIVKNKHCAAKFDKNCSLTEHIICEIISTVSRTTCTGVTLRNTSVSCGGSDVKKDLKLKAKAKDLSCQGQGQGLECQGQGQGQGLEIGP